MMENIVKNNRPEPKKIVLSLSGGMDSATLLGYYLSKGHPVHAITFYYGSKHGVWESKAAESLIDFYQSKGFPLTSSVIDLRQVFVDVESNLLKTGEDIPEGHYEAVSMKKTVVPGRNLIFASIVAAIAESQNADVVALGVHAGDHHIYPDCRPEFITALNETIIQSSDAKLEVQTPFLHFTKIDILKIGLHECIPAIPYELTRTCYKDQPISCGKCGSCVERLEAFKELQIKDTIIYEKDEKTK